MQGLKAAGGVGPFGVRRPRGRPFRPGVSGNPKGRPKGARNKASLLAEALRGGEAEVLSRVYGAVLALGDRTMLERSRACKTSGLAEPLLETNVAVFFEPDLGPCVHAFLRDETSLRGTQCLVALRRWQLEHREPPKDLETLVKAAGMKGVPIDPYSDQPLRMTMLENVPVVYSVGPDGKDDGARTVWDGHPDHPGDMVFRMEPATR